MKKVILLLMCVISTYTYTYSQNIKKSNSRVIDEANIINISSEQEMGDIIARSEKVCGIQMCVYTTNSLEGLESYEYATRVGKILGVGEKGKNNGIVILIAPTERKCFIATGYGLEGILPDIKVKQIQSSGMNKSELRSGIYEPSIIRMLNSLTEEISASNIIEHNKKNIVVDNNIIETPKKAEIPTDYTYFYFSLLMLIILGLFLYLIYIIVKYFKDLSKTKVLIQEKYSVFQSFFQTIQKEKENGLFHHDIDIYYKLTSEIELQCPNIIHNYSLTKLNIIFKNSSDKYDSLKDCYESFKKKVENFNKYTLKKINCEFLKYQQDLSLLDEYKKLDNLLKTDLIFKDIDNQDILLWLSSYKNLSDSLANVLTLLEKKKKFLSNDKCMFIPEFKTLVSQDVVNIYKNIKDIENFDSKINKVVEIINEWNFIKKYDSAKKYKDLAEMVGSLKNQEVYIDEYNRLYIQLLQLNTLSAEFMNLDKFDNQSDYNNVVKCYTDLRYKFKDVQSEYNTLNYKLKEYHKMKNDFNTLKLNIPKKSAELMRRFNVNFNGILEVNSLQFNVKNYNTLSNHYNAILDNLQRCENEERRRAEEERRRLEEIREAERRERRREQEESDRLAAIAALAMASSSRSDDSGWSSSSSSTPSSDFGGGDFGGSGSESSF